MADDDDLDYSDTNVGSAQAHTVRKNISLKLKGKSRGGRGKKGSRGRRSSSSKKSSSGIIDDEVMSITDNTPSSEKSISEMISLEDVISKLETPAFSQMDRAFPEPMHQNKKLRWDHKVNLIGEKVVNPMIHCCEKCTLPILIYGRIVPCKHVFCFDCARKMEKLCFKCEEQVQKVEQASLGTVFMCIFGGSRYGPVTCGRTYLSQRDLQAHINHRHLKTVTSATGNVSAQCNPSHSSSAIPLNPSAARDPRDPRGHLLSDVAHPSEVGMIGHAQHSHGPSDHRDPSDHPLGSAMSSSSIPTGSAATQRQYPHSPANYSSTVPVSSARPNLITVPIQDDSSAVSTQHVHSQQPHSSQYPPAGSLTAHPLPSHQHPVSGYPPLPHAYQHPIPAAAPAYSQAPPMTTQAFTPHPPPQVHHPPPMHTGPATLYSTPPPVHHPPPVTYSVPQTAGNPHSTHALPPQRFPTSTGYDEPYQLQPWSAATAPPPTRGSLPPRPITAPSATSHPLIPPQLGPSDPSFRPPYYQ